ncbi:MAG: response regulator [Candidatus Brocadiae bacterium]|nr:response regulator [Candidatus Brocadiia bacterium]
MKRFFTSADVGRVCGMSVPTVLKRFEEGLLKGYKTRGDKGELRVTRQYLLDFMERLGVPREELDRTEASQEKRRILMVDDDEVLLKALKANFAQDSRIDVDVRVANNAVDTLFACGNTRPDLIILDLKIPGMRGEKVLEFIKTSAELNETKVVVFSGYPRFKVKVLKAGADAFVAKPDVKGLKDTVYALLGIERRNRVETRAQA